MATKKKYSKSELADMPKLEEPTQAHTHLAQGMEVVSSHGNRIRLIASVPGAVGFSPDGQTVFEYTAAAHFSHTLDEFPIVNLNHHADEVIGAIVSSETDLDGRLILEVEIFEPYSYFVPIIRDGLNDGHSIEGIIESGHMVSDTRVLVDSYLLTGIGFLFTKPPACDKDICRVLSSNADNAEDLAKLGELITEMQPDELQESYSNLMNEIRARGLNSENTTETSE